MGRGGRVKREKLGGGCNLRASGRRTTSGDPAGDWASTNQVSGFVIAPNDLNLEFD